MNTRITSYLIIGLCSVSLFVGILSATLPSLQTKNSNQVANFNNIMYSGDKIALISLDGVISSENNSSELLGSPNTAVNVQKLLKKATDDPQVKGILLQINSPGGTVGQSQEIYNTILRLRKKKPVVIAMSDIAASGGYYIASAGDRIFANPGTLTGSIGVIMSSFNVKNLVSNKLGIDSVVIKSGKFKDIGSPYRTMTQDEKNLLQDVVNSTYQQFVKAITKGRVERNDNYKIAKRDLTAQRLKKYADGRIFTGETAYKLGFVDELGGSYEAQQAVNKMAKQKFNLHSDKLPLVPYSVSGGLNQLLFGVTESIFPNKFNAENLVPMSAKFSRQPLFIWE